mgnify:CR=1 FL=1
MKKKVLASLLCASMVATMFAGCGSSNGNGTEKADKKVGGKETITVMGPAEDLDDAQALGLRQSARHSLRQILISTSSSSMLHHLSQTQRMLLQRILSSS